MPRIHIPDDAPPVLAVSGVWPELAARAELDYYDTLARHRRRLIERIGTAEVVLNIRSSSRFTERVFAACPGSAAALGLGHRHRPRRSGQPPRGTA